MVFEGTDFLHRNSSVILFRKSVLKKSRRKKLFTINQMTSHFMYRLIGQKAAEQAEAFFAAKEAKEENV